VIPRRRRARVLAVAVVLAPALVAAAKLTGGGNAAKPRVTTLRVGYETDISKSAAIESESAVTIDPRNPRILLAGSNAVGKPWMAVFASTDGGRTWRRSRVRERSGTSLCGTSDPTVAIDRRGHQYYAFLGLRCAGNQLRSSRIYVATRRSASAPWRVFPIRVPHSRGTLMDDRPFLLADNGTRNSHRGRLYLAWTRFVLDPNVFFVYPDEVDDLEPVTAVALVSRSEDGGRHWSKPMQLAAENSPLEVRLAAANDGTLYAVWRSEKTGAVQLASSSDGKHFGPARLVAGAVVDPKRSCGGSRARIRAQPRRCVSPNPVISVDTSAGPRAGRVYVTWGTTSLNRSQDVYVAAFDPALHPLLGVGKVQQVNPPEQVRGSDQFLPASAVDPATGRLWACYYSSGSRRGFAKLARYTCTFSDDGGETWVAPHPVASRASNETVKRANRANGYGDYEGVAASGARAYAVWTDGRSLRRSREEIYGAMLYSAKRHGRER
jgi:hypothetical protein